MINVDKKKMALLEKEFEGLTEAVKRGHQWTPEQKMLLAKHYTLSHRDEFIERWRRLFPNAPYTKTTLLKYTRIFKRELADAK